MRIVSFNVAGLRQKVKKIDKSFADYDIVCLQETRLNVNIPYPMFKNFQEWHAISKDKGQKGVSILINNKFKEEIKEKYHNSFQGDTGRILIITTDKLVIINTYLPYVSNAKNKKLIKHKRDMLNFIKRKIKEFKEKGYYVLLCMDGNIARSVEEYDIYPSHRNPHAQPSFRPDEIKIYADFSYDVDGELFDVQAEREPDKIQYTYFSKQTSKKNIMWEKNLGLTNDFMFLDKRLEKNVRDFKIDYSHRQLSDHCPLVLEISF